MTQLFEEQGNAVEGFAKEALKTGLRVPKALFSRTGPPAGRAFLLALEQALWTELVSVRRLELKYQRKHGKDADRLALSDELLQLMPPAPADGWTVQMPSTPPATEWLRRWEYPPVRRAQRLSFMMATLLPALDRQRLLQASSVRERLQLSIVHLRGRKREVERGEREDIKRTQERGFCTRRGRGERTMLYSPCELCSLVPHSVVLWRERVSVCGVCAVRSSGLFRCIVFRV